MFNIKYFIIQGHSQIIDQLHYFLHNSLNRSY